MVQLFNVGALFILFRETVEGAIILSVLLRAVDKTVEDPLRRKVLKKHVWAGVIIGGLISIIVGGGFAVAFWVLGQDVFGNSKAVWEGSFQAIAAILLTFLAFAMLKVSHLYHKWEAKIHKAAHEALKKPDFFGLEDETNGTSSSSHQHINSLAKLPRKSFFREYSFGILSFTIVIREGMESVLFLTGVGQSDPISLIIPGVVGFILGILVGYLVWRGAGKMRLDLFFRISAVFLFIVAAGLASNAAAAFESYNVSRVLARLGSQIVLDST
ncbi:hypothetical protein SmJEL517_g01855 [Synchytrium microbalum]|uniref:Iron permease FTR1 n=1 Tax=Synchytrium microbalum TaxID=1806994 RepID=A0A507CEI9_9FUNG|nr:uncharacterized protein SmJEL517_g01855 [Synchytrium microbalum]TPX35995.1 hypothetical protein SmJEL517_g01855 [Synchytrium microbalum]